MQPPGKRNVAGRKSAISCPMSARRPFGRSLNFFIGESDTSSRSSVPGDAARICNVACRTFAVGTSVAAKCRHSSGAGAKRTRGARCRPLAPAIATWKAVSPRAQSESESGTPFSTLSSCIGPSLHTPAPPSNASMRR